MSPADDLADRIVEGQLLDDQMQLQLTEFVSYCRVENALVIEMVELGVLEPQGAAPNEWRFAARDLRRARTALRLSRDLGVNYEGAAVILDLLDERDAMLARLRTLQTALLR